MPLEVASRRRRRRRLFATRSIATKARVATRRRKRSRKLKPAFQANGTVTAGNSSQTSDGAAAVVVMSEDARARARLTPLARSASTPPPASRLNCSVSDRYRPCANCSHAGLTLADIDLVELNEAFAAQVLACLQELPIDPDRLNVNGGAIALGHPLGCTGARLTTTNIHEMRRRQVRRGMITLCVGGGMGAALILER